jgi:prepilin-type processing-associated H-X9-DG protein
MNQAVGTQWYGGNSGHNPVGGGWLPGTYNSGQTTWRTYGKTASMILPTPSMLWVLIDEHPDSINDAGLSVECGLTGASAMIVDMPASYHDGACGLSFADGHSEIHKWLDTRTKPKATYAFPATMALNVSTPNNPDVDWLQARTSALQKNSRRKFFALNSARVASDDSLDRGPGRRRAVAVSGIVPRLVAADDLAARGDERGRL